MPVVMTAAQKKQRAQHLQSMHQMYHAYNQTECKRSRMLADLGHPLRTLYQAVADTFFSLYYCSNASTRLLASDHEGREEVSLHMPTIRESDKQYTIGGETRYIPRANFEAASAFYQDFAAAGFPGSEAFLGCIFTSICIKSARQDVLEAIRQYVKDSPYLVMEPLSGYYMITLERAAGKTPPIHAFNHLIGLLKRLFKPYLLRTPREQMPAETPFQQRPFMMGNVKSVTVKPHHILVPLLSTHDNDHNLAVVHQVEELLQRGYPFTAEVEHFLKGVIQPTALKKMKKSFLAASA